MGGHCERVDVRARAVTSVMSVPGSAGSCGREPRWRSREQLSSRGRCRRRRRRRACTAPPRCTRRTCTPRHMVVARVARRESWRAALKASSTTVLRLYPRSKSVSHYVLQRWLALQIAGWLHRFLLPRGWKPTRLWHHHDDGLDAQ